MGLGAGLLTAEPAYAGGVRTLRESHGERIHTKNGRKMWRNLEKIEKTYRNVRSYKNVYSIVTIRVSQKISIMTG